MVEATVLFPASVTQGLALEGLPRFRAPGWQLHRDARSAHSFVLRLL